MSGLRNKFITEIIKELRGPRDGPYECFSDGRDPYNEYVSGIIIPAKIDSSQSVQLEVDGPDLKETINLGLEDEESGTENNELDYSVPNQFSPKDPPKSFGLSFLVSGDQVKLNICVSWARYGLEQSETQKIWRREPFIHSFTFFPLENKKITVYSSEDGSVELSIRVISSKHNEKHSHVIITLINNLNDVDKWDMRGKNALFQPSIRINVNSGKLIRDDSNRDNELEHIYRNQNPYGRGHMCAAIWRELEYPDDVVDPKLVWPEQCCNQDLAEEFIKCDIRTEFLPLNAHIAPDFHWPANNYPQPELSALKLSEAWNSDHLKQYLWPLAESYALWSEQLSSTSNGAIEEKIIGKQRICLQRIQQGIQCLLDNKDARLAFCFANKVIWQQNKWKQQQKRGRNSGPELKEFTWYPFQLAFFLTCLESLYNPDSNYRDVLDLLWVPTGGGKTEAYLAIMAFTMSLRRIRARLNGSPDTGGGVSIFTRYTLRLLTVQQFRRTLFMVTAAEYLRVMRCHNGLHGWRPNECDIDTNWLYGEIRYSTGMLVGGGVSPNHLGDATSKDNLHGAITALMGKHSESEPAQLIKCPVCGAWLSLPQDGLPAGTNALYLTIETELEWDALEAICSSVPQSLDNAELTALSVEKRLLTREERNHCYSLLLKITSNCKINSSDIDNYVRRLIDNNDEGILIPGKLLSFRGARPGYFPKPNEPVGKNKKNIIPPDFDIYCPNPNCDLNENAQWGEVTPLKRDRTDITNPYALNNSIPIPAYTVDEQILHRCPTVIVATADKIARLAFDPRYGSLFGDVHIYNQHCGFMRGTHESYYPRYRSDVALKDAYMTEVKAFLPPDLIIQDELHLLDGPLGSMFGLYELMVRALCRENGGHPKYIASSATVNNAEYQVSRLFNTSIQQFPPYGTDSKNSFFVRYSPDDLWNSERPGRVYMGIMGLGKTVLTTNIRIWASLLKCGKDSEEDEYINNFWTIVGYCNAIRELGGLCSLYRADIIERLEQISSAGESRSIDLENYIELSSRRSSTELPQILEILEQGGTQHHSDNHDAIFTTSMFGTGVDIPHLSLMVMNGQPKTTAQYIQATGRVGRKHSAFVPVLYKGSRPRDLSHYEMFSGYHNRLDVAVEQASVSPFSTGCLERALPGIMVAFLRNAKEHKIKWEENDGHLISRQPDDAETDYGHFLDMCKKCLNPNDLNMLTPHLRSEFDRWKSISEKSDDSELPYTESTKYKPAQKNIVLGDPAHILYNNDRIQHVKWSVFKNVPQSLRDVEDTTGLGVEHEE